MNLQLSMGEAEIFSSLISKIDKIKDTLEKVHAHTQNSDSEKNITYLEKLNELSTIINNLNSISDDLYDEFILGLPENALSNEEKEKRQLVINNKKIYNTFAPYMLYMGVILQNQNSPTQ
jgi:hypothetical protein